MSKELEQEKKLNSFHFNFSLDTPESLTEEKQESISKYLLKWFTTRVTNMGFHPSNYRIINEWYQEEKTGSAERFGKFFDEMHKEPKWYHKISNYLYNTFSLVKGVFFEALVPAIIIIGIIFSILWFLSELIG